MLQIHLSLFNSPFSLTSYFQGQTNTGGLKCADCCKQPQTIIIQPPPTPPYATLLSGSGAAVYVIVINGTPALATAQAEDLAGAPTNPTHGCEDDGDLPDVGTACLCGPECQCVGCLLHPYNSATEQYVRSAFSGNTIDESPLTVGEDTSTPQPPASGPMAGHVGRQMAPADDFFFLDFPLAPELEVLNGLQGVAGVPAEEGGGNGRPGPPRPGTPIFTVTG